MNDPFTERWNANADLYANDICLFLEDQWRVRDAPPNMMLGPQNTIRLLDHQKRILREMFKRDANGNLHYRLMIYSTIKKSGKTEIEGGVAEWAALVESGTPEIFFIGNDKEQAQTRAFAAVAMQVDPESKAFNPVLARHFRLPGRLTKSTDTIYVNGGGFLKSIPIDYAGEAGANPLASLWDELWGADREAQRRLWDEFPPPPTRGSAFRFVASYAGFRNESDLLWSLYERIVGGDDKSKRRRHRHPAFKDLPVYVSADGREIAYWDEGIEARRMPWQTPEYYENEKAANRPEMFSRIHTNLWAENATNFVTAEQYDALPRYARIVPNVNRAPVYVTVDAAHKRDTTTALSLEYLGQPSPASRPVTRIEDKATWRPSVGNVVLPEETALPWVRNKIETTNVKAVRYDPAHFETAAEILKREYPMLDIQPLTQSVSNLTDIGTALYDAIAFRSLIVLSEPEDDPDSLRAHVLNAVAVPTPTGYRMVKGKDINKVDGAICLGMAQHVANARGREDSETHRAMYILGALDDDDDL